MGTVYLQNLALDYYKYKRASGLLFERGEYWINRYLTFQVEKYPDCVLPCKDSVEAFESSITGRDNTGLSYLKEFCKYLHILGHDVYIPKTRFFNIEHEPPYIISDHEGDTFFYTLDNLENVNSLQWTGKGIILPAFFRMMWCIGTRTKETRTLLCTDINLDKRYVDIINAKGQKDRRIFLSVELQNYFEKYDSEISVIRPNRKYFFPGGTDEFPVSAASILKNFKSVWYKAFPDFDRDTHVNPYDFRHHFVYANINRWLRDGKDVNVMIYYLMQVTGHKSVDELLYYFHLVPEIYETIKVLAKDLDAVYPKEYIKEGEDKDS